MSGPLYHFGWSKPVLSCHRPFPKHQPLRGLTVQGTIVGGEWVRAGKVLKPKLTKMSLDFPSYEKAMPPPENPP